MEGTFPNYLADSGHPGHSELGVTVQLQGLLAEEEVDLVVIPLLAADALPHQGWTHKVRLCKHTRRRGASESVCFTDNSKDIHRNYANRQPQPVGVWTESHTHARTRTLDTSVSFLATPSHLSIFYHRTFASSLLQSFLALSLQCSLLAVHFVFLTSPCLSQNLSTCCPH